MMRKSFPAFLSTTKLHQNIRPFTDIHCKHRTYGEQSSGDSSSKFRIGLLSGIGLVGAAAAVSSNSEDGKEKEAGMYVDGLPTYTANEVGQRDGSNLDDKNLTSSKIWISYKRGVYDVTDFVNEHPGGDKLLIGAGGPVEPFWSLYEVHKKPYVFELLEKYRIGNLAEEDQVDEDSNDPYKDEPKRHPIFSINNNKPFNAEPPLNILADNFITPNELFYVRNHHPVPIIDREEYELQIGEGNDNTAVYSLSDLETKFEQVTITAAIQCAGNRRLDMAKHKNVRGMNWGGAAISNAVWEGPRLRDVLLDIGFSEEKYPDIKHVCVDGLDFGPDGTPYGASILIEKAMDPRQDVILALKMNGETLPRDHGYPVRLVAPGIVGARNVKWVGSISLSQEESHSHWQRRDYKGFNPAVDWHNVNFDDPSAVSIQNQPVTSMVCDPLDNSNVKIKNGKIPLKGYAFSGAGAKIIRVDVTLDKGESWHTAVLTQDDSPLNRCWSWSLWELDVPIPENIQSGDTIQVTCCAVDANYNRQPEKVKNIWNLRGCLSNAWHTVNLTLEL